MQSGSVLASAWDLGCGSGLVYGSAFLPGCWFVWEHGYWLAVVSRLVRQWGRECWLAVALACHVAGPIPPRRLLTPNGTAYLTKSL